MRKTAGSAPTIGADPLPRICAVVRQHGDRVPELI